jgi:hypothetical protein
MSDILTSQNNIDRSSQQGHNLIQTSSAGFTYRLDRLKPRASTFRGRPVKVYTIFNSVIGLSHVCCHSVLYFLNNPSVVFLAQLDSISEYCRILNTLSSSLPY